MAAPLLAQALMGYEPIVEKRRNALAMRLTVAPEDAATSMASLYRELAPQWTHGGAAIALRSTATLDDELLAVAPVDSVWIEIPASSLDDEEGRARVLRMHESGFRMLLAGRPRSPLSPELVEAFRMSIIHVDEDRRLREAVGAVAPVGWRRTIPYVQEGVRTIAAMENCFAHGAHAVIGWPMEDALQHAGSADSNPDYATIVELIAMIDRGEDTGAMERLIRRDVALAYKLLRYINSPGFGLSVEIQSFRHAVMMLGYTRLKRWLALLLTTSCKDANMRPVMLASFRRGIFLEHLIGVGPDENLRDEVFILGVFSLLDKLLKKPFDELFDKLHVPERVRETLVERRGPYAPYLEVVKAIELGPDPLLHERLDDCVMSIEQCNRALLRALTAPDLLAA